MESCRFLRPAASARLRASLRPAHARFFAAYQALHASDKRKPNASLDGPTGDHARRVAMLSERKGLDQCYPRISPRAGESKSARASAAYLNAVAERLDNGQTGDESFEVYGRVQEVRALSSKLVFLKCEHNGTLFQVVCNRGRLDGDQDVADRLKQFRGLVRRGDWISASGYAYKTEKGGAALLAAQVPNLVSPSLHQVPQELEDHETRSRKPHVGMLVDPDVTKTLRIRSRIETTLMRWFEDRGFCKVGTPILSSQAGGAIARSFETTASELSGTPLHLRIAPELWLKRLVIGGMDRMYELGPAFRNEGVDSTHNPEFTMCEFYSPFTTLNELMLMTEDLLEAMTKAVQDYGTVPALLSQSSCTTSPNSAQASDMTSYTGEFQLLPFIPTLEAQMRDRLPDLAAADTRASLLALFAKHSLPVPDRATVPVLLDTLAGHYIEPLCDTPTFITHHPAPLSPLAKTFPCPDTGQIISARAELFIQGREYANMYEEENSPFEQRRKFEAQLAYRRKVDPDVKGEVDESYLEALEWGLPPTGGWGMGIDRLTMLFSGRARIADVLPFGTLRNVVGLQQVDRRRERLK